MGKIFLLSTVIVSFLFSDVSVKGYYKSNGTYVEPHYRSSPNDTKSDNWTTKGNVNPYTDEEGTKTYNNYNNYGRSSGNYYNSNSYDSNDENYYSKYGIYSSNDCIKMDFDRAIEDCVDYFIGENKQYSNKNNSPNSEEKNYHLMIYIVAYIFAYIIIFLIIMNVYHFFASHIYETITNKKYKLSSKAFYILIILPIIIFIMFNNFF